MTRRSPVTSALPGSSPTKAPVSTESQDSAGKSARTSTNGNGRDKLLATATPTAIRADSATHPSNITAKEDY